MTRSLFSVVMSSALLDNTDEMGCDEAGNESKAATTTKVSPGHWLSTTRVLLLRIPRNQGASTNSHSHDALVPEVMIFHDTDMITLLDDSSCSFFVSVSMSRSFPTALSLTSPRHDRSCFNGCQGSRASGEWRRDSVC